MHIKSLLKLVNSFILETKESNLYKLNPEFSTLPIKLVSKSKFLETKESNLYKLGPKASTLPIKIVSILIKIFLKISY